MRKLLAILAAALCLSLSARAQNSAFDALKNRNDKKFQDHIERTDKNFREHREATNAKFEDALRQPWEKKSAKKAKQKPRNKDNDIPPVVIDDDKRQVPPEDKPIVPDEIQPAPKPEPAPEPPSPVIEVPEQKDEKAVFNLYGTKFSVRYPWKPRLTGVEEKKVADMWAELSRKDYDNMLVDLLTQKKRLDLCDWAYLKVVEKFTEQLYGSDLSPEAVVMQTYILAQSGFRLYIARDSGGKLHKLVLTDRNLYRYPYIMVGSQRGYLTDGGSGKSYYVMGEAFEGTVPLSISQMRENRFTTLETKPRELKSRDFPAAKVTVTANKNLIDFYNTYPNSYTDNDAGTSWKFYANTPLSLIARDSMYPALKAAIEGMNDFQAVSVLLNFVQTAFVYGYDNEIWGGERVFFSDETLFYPYSDCEDRSILFSRLVRDLVGRPVVLLNYPNHLAAAVNFSGEVSGAYLNVDGKKFVVCDPTYIGAPVGLSMPSTEGATCKVIRL